ncbi:titin-like isoform X2 [Neocloeon triangulifer]|uniref:titin-like isoform X2 n=1 Tax=Neocloeon triangulifer TaxID=2078957 RepID=UPI00286F5245|nr:titin-like isoform X2 [Neocloeon triangulifer]
MGICHCNSNSARNRMTMDFSVLSYSLCLIFLSGQTFAQNLQNIQPKDNEQMGVIKNGKCTCPFANLINNQSPNMSPALNKPIGPPTDNQNMNPLTNPQSEPSESTNNAEESADNPELIEDSPTDVSNILPEQDEENLANNAVDEAQENESPVPAEIPQNLDANIPEASPDADVELVEDPEVQINSDVPTPDIESPTNNMNVGKDLENELPIALPAVEGPIEAPLDQGLTVPENVEDGIVPELVDNENSDIIETGPEVDNEQPVQTPDATYTAPLENIAKTEAAPSNVQAIPQPAQPSKVSPAVSKTVNEKPQVPQANPISPIQSPVKQPVPQVPTAPKVYPTTEQPKSLVKRPTIKPALSAPKAPLLNSNVPARDSSESEESEEEIFKKKKPKVVTPKPIHTSPVSQIKPAPGLVSRPVYKEPLPVAPAGQNIDSDEEKKAPPKLPGKSPITNQIATIGVNKKVPVVPQATAAPIARPLPAKVPVRPAPPAAVPVQQNPSPVQLSKVPAMPPKRPVGSVPVAQNPPASSQAQSAPQSPVVPPSNANKKVVRPVITTKVPKVVNPVSSKVTPAAKPVGKFVEDRTTTVPPVVLQPEDEVLSETLEAKPIPPADSLVNEQTDGVSASEDEISGSDNDHQGLRPNDAAEQANVIPPGLEENNAGSDALEEAAPVVTEPSIPKTSITGIKKGVMMNGQCTCPYNNHNPDVAPIPYQGTAGR